MSDLLVPFTCRPTTRRRALFGIAATATLPLAGCSASGGSGASASGDSRRTELPGRAALIAPMTGRAAELGQIIANAASLGGDLRNPGAEMQLFDTGDTSEGAAGAAERAVAAGARMIVGPLFGDQAAAAKRAAGNVPVITLSNDSSVARRALFAMGLSPEQSAQSVLSFARRRGLSSVGVVVPPGAFGTRAAQAALQAGRALGLDMIGPVTASDPDTARAALEGTPAAVYLPSGGPELEPLARAFSGTQILGSAQWSALDPSGIAALDGALYAAPDPLAFEPFVSAYQDAYGDTPGILAGIAFDAVESVRLLGRIGQQDTQGLLRENGFNGVLGPYSFNRDGTCNRALSVLRVGRDGVSLVGAATV